MAFKHQGKILIIVMIFCTIIAMMSVTLMESSILQYRLLAEMQP